MALKEGIYTKDSSKKENINTDEILENPQINDLLNAQITDYYALHYVTIGQSFEVSTEDYSPLPITENSFPWFQDEKLLNLCSEKLLWISIDLPEFNQLKELLYTDLVIALNIVPTANKQLHSVTKNTKKELGIIPLEMESGESFLDVASVYDDYNQSYIHSHGFSSNLGQNTYTLRQGGSESFDKRNAKDFLVRLESLLEDEESLFTTKKQAMGKVSI